MDTDRADGFGSLQRGPRSSPDRSGRASPDPRDVDTWSEDGPPRSVGTYPGHSSRETCGPQGRGVPPGDGPCRSRRNSGSLLWASRPVPPRPLLWGSDRSPLQWASPTAPRPSSWSCFGTPHPDPEPQPPAGHRGHPRVGVSGPLGPCPVLSCVGRPASDTFTKLPPKNLCHQLGNGC